MTRARPTVLRPLALVSAALVTALLAACGDDGGSRSATTPAGTTTAQTTTPAPTTTAAPAPTRAEFIAEVDKLCAATQKRQSVLRREAEGKSLEQLAPTLRKQSAIARELFNDIKALTPPTEDRVPVRKFADSIRQISVYSKALAGSVEANHRTPMRNLSVKLVNSRNREHQLGQGYGFKVCANGPGY